jgi:dolichol-phosphate mannosyltransferase
MSNSSIKIAVVIAAYNEAENIGPLTRRLIETLDGMDGRPWELIYVIEGKDATLATAQAFASERPQIRILYDPAPSGLGNAFRRGFQAISPDADVVVTMDADLNHQPEEIPRLIGDLLDSGADIVVGSRKLAESHVEGAPYWKTTLSNLVNVGMRKLIGMPVADQTSGYRVYRYEALQSISFRNTGFAFLPEILIQAHARKLRIVERPIKFVFRKAGESKMTVIPTARSYLSLFFGRLFRR